VNSYNFQGKPGDSLKEPTWHITQARAGLIINSMNKESDRTKLETVPGADMHSVAGAQLLIVAISVTSPDGCYLLAVA